MAASLAIFAVPAFTVIKPSSDTANQAVTSGLQQSQQVLNQSGPEAGHQRRRSEQLGHQGRRGLSSGA
jgi:hypothetical protein